MGLVNRCDRLRGVQIGLLNVSRDHTFPYIPLLNVRWAGGQ